MRIILDECLPRRLGSFLHGHQVSTVPQAGWAGITNSKLLERIAGEYDAFLTVDQNLPAQQKVSALAFGVIVLRTPTNRLEHLKPFVPQILQALSQLKPGLLMRIPPG